MVLWLLGAHAAVAQDSASPPAAAMAVQSQPIAEETSPAGVESQSSDRVESEVAKPRALPSSGPMLSLGIGNDYALMGAQLAYAFSMPDTLWQLAPFASVGVVLGFVDSSNSASGQAQVLSERGYAAGLQAFYGRSNRLVLELAFAPIAARIWSLHGTPVAMDVLYGGSAIIGYEYLFASGLFFRFGAGGGVFRDDHRFKGAIVATMGLGWKLW